MKVTVHTPLSREVFWHVYAKVPMVTSQNPSPKVIFTRNCESTEQFRLLKNGAMGSFYKLGLTAYCKIPK